MASFCYTGVSIVHPRVFADCPDGAFSMNLLYDRAEAAIACSVGPMTVRGII